MWMDTDPHHRPEPGQGEKKVCEKYREEKGGRRQWPYVEKGNNTLTFVVNFKGQDR